MIIFLPFAPLLFLFTTVSCTIPQLMSLENDRNTTDSGYGFYNFSSSDDLTTLTLPVMDLPPSTDYLYENHSFSLLDSYSIPRARHNSIESPALISPKSSSSSTVPFASLRKNFCCCLSNSCFSFSLFSAYFCCCLCYGLKMNLISSCCCCCCCSLGSCCFSSCALSKSTDTPSENKPV